MATATSHKSVLAAKNADLYEASDAISQQLICLESTIASLKQLYESKIADLNAKVEKLRGDRETISIKYAKCKTDLDKILVQSKEKCNCLKRISLESCSDSILNISNERKCRRTPKKLSSLAMSLQNKDVNETSAGVHSPKCNLENRQDNDFQIIPETVPCEQVGTKTKEKCEQHRHSTPKTDIARPSLRNISAQLLKSVSDSSKKLARSTNSIPNETVLTSSLNVIGNSVIFADSKHADELIKPTSAANENEEAKEEDNESDEPPSPIIGRSSSNVMPVQKYVSQIEGPAPNRSRQSQNFETANKKDRTDLTRRSLSMSNIEVLVSNTPSPGTRRERSILDSTDKGKVIPESCFNASPCVTEATSAKVGLDSLFAESPITRSTKKKSLDAQSISSTQLIDSTRLMSSFNVPVSPLTKDSKVAAQNQDADWHEVHVHQESMSQPIEVLNICSPVSKTGGARGVRPRAAKITYTRSSMDDSQCKLKLVAPSKVGKKKQSKNNKTSAALAKKINESIEVLEDSFDLVPGSKNDKPKFKYQEVVRGQSSRQKLTGKSCKDCEDYYKSAGVDPKNIENRMNGCSRHRVQYTPPKTPLHYWSLDFPPTPVDKNGGKNCDPKRKRSDRIINTDQDEDGVSVAGRAKRRRPLANK